MLQKVHFKIFDFAMSSFVNQHLVLKSSIIKQFISPYLVICPFDSLSTYLVHCPLSQSLASTWKQDFKLNFVSILEHLHFCVIIPFADSFSKPFAASFLSVPKENLRSCEVRHLAWNQYLISIALLSDNNAQSFQTGLLVQTRHICTESLMSKVNHNCTLCLGWDGSNNQS